MNETFGYTKSELEAQYNARAGRPDFDTHVMPSWLERSADVRNEISGVLDQPYGSNEPERIDFFPAEDRVNAPILVFLHGGYWQRGDRKAYSFIAEPFVKNGVAVAVVGYQLCPAVRLREIAPNIVSAIKVLWRQATVWGGNKQKIFLSGHSAGGHLTGMLMANDWREVSPLMPQRLINAAIPISGLMDLRPLLSTSINKQLHMDEKEAIEASPINHPPLTDAPQLVVCGEKEPNEFHRQSDIYADAFRTKNRLLQRYVVPSADHFDELEILADGKSAFFHKVLNLINNN